MAITIQGIRVNDIQLEFNVEKGLFEIKTATYSLISSSGKVLAKQIVGGYQGMALEPSAKTKVAMDGFTQSYVVDIQVLLGLLEEKA